ncbi:hypothetical protein [Marisediminicola sp. LYQ134]|uniref:hypothetical protein n=1 Tax=Marisediminicola sp. LYQ134 TaxID=3391061 RepID=UPI003982F476
MTFRTRTTRTLGLAEKAMLGVVAGAALAAAAVLTTLVSVAVCAALAWLCLRVFVGRPFVASATAGIGVVAILIVAGGLGSSFLTSVAHAQIGDYLALTEAGVPLFELSVDLAPLGWGVALAVVAGAFELGQRMQRDTTGLV